MTKLYLVIFIVTTIMLFDEFQIDRFVMALIFMGLFFLPDKHNNAPT